MQKKYLAYRDAVLVYLIMAVTVIICIIYFVFPNADVVEKWQCICILGIALLALFLIMFRLMFTLLIITEKGVTKKFLRKEIYLPWEEIRQIYVVSYGKIVTALINTTDREMEAGRDTLYSFEFTLTKKIKKSLYKYCPREDLKVMIERMKMKE